MTLQPSCEKCGVDWIYDVDGVTFSRRIAIYSRELDRTVAWRCPDCGDEVPR